MATRQSMNIQMNTTDIHSLYNEAGDDDTFTGPIAPPPAYDDTILQTGPEDNTGFRPLPSLDESEARSALVEHTAEMCCYSTDKARNMDIQGIDTSMIYKYSLRTMAEKRCYVIVVKPHPKNGPVDGPKQGGIPNIWSLKIPPREMFVNHSFHVPLPHTDVVKVCGSCMGTGTMCCPRCGGSGIRPVISLIPIRPCYPCGGRGKFTCLCCCGRGMRKFSLKVEVTWTVHQDTVSVRSTNWNLSSSETDTRKFTKSRQYTLFENEQVKVRRLESSPAANIPPLIQTGSQSLLEKHAQASEGQRIIRQYHSLGVIPITQVVYRKKNKTDSYFICGTERKVRFPESLDPCTIL